MKFTAALSLLMSTAHAQEYARMTQLRGADLSTPPKKKIGTVKLTHASTIGGKNTVHLDPATLVSLSLSAASGDDAAELAICQPFADEKECNASPTCIWCKSGAVSSACYPSEFTARLPAGVFECASKNQVGENVAVSEERARMVASRMERLEDRIVSKAEEVVEEVVEKKLKSEFFNLKHGITLTLTSDSVDKEFCDPNSDVSLAGYMNVKGSQFDTNNDKIYSSGYEPNETPSETSSDSNKESNTAQSSSADVSSDETPLVIWLTGGPGCSSSLALLTENGPCSVNADGESTSVNPYSWTESAHVLWLDQPADVGYSYGQENDSNEEMISEDAYYFLQAFFQSEEGQKYKNNPLFIVGESYGGHYAPAIAHRIWRGNKNVKEGLLSLNLKGLAVGNGLTNPEIQYQYYSEMAFKNSHNIQVIDENTYNGMKTAEPICVKGIQQCNDGDGMLNGVACQAAFYGCNMALTSPYRMTGLNPYDIRKPCGDNPLCYDFSHVEKFMNSDTTKKALHVDTHNPTWQTCNMMINMSFHTDWMKDFSGYVADLLNDGIPALIYAGDVDFICNYLGNKAWTTELEWNHGAEFKAAEDHDWNNGAGLARTAGGLTFLQVYDAGHMVPSDQPEHALTMITQFLNGEHF
ncbi:hypothetical protein HJC23_001469 [Cyclotella cryptica]|uniref:Carboxypeptidase n=1 Tax=Cyclotella cryptica TaxID=29204 RepID=A0ABD3NSL6_9STRA